MGETREQLTLPLLRSRLTDEPTGLVTRAWQPWFEALDRIIRNLESGLTDVESDPQQGDIAAPRRGDNPIDIAVTVPRRSENPIDIPVPIEHEVRRLAAAIEQVQVFSEVSTAQALLLRVAQDTAKLDAGG